MQLGYNGEQLTKNGFWGKINGAWAKGASKNLGPPIYPQNRQILAKTGQFFSTENAEQQRSRVNYS